MEGLHDAGRDPGVALRPGRALDQLRADHAGPFHAHAGADAATPGLVGAGDDAGPGQAVGHGHGPAVQGRVIVLLDGGEKGVHVHQRNGPRPERVVVDVRHKDIGL